MDFALLRSAKRPRIFPMSGSYWLDQSSQRKDKHFDIVVVGGGISGLSTAYWLLVEDSQLKIAVLDKKKLGEGATGRNAGFVTCGSVEHFNRLVGKLGEEKALAIWQFAAKNLDLIKEHIVRDQANTLDFQQRGAYSLAARKVNSKSCARFLSLWISTIFLSESWTVVKCLKN